ncbi:MAG: choice-of-anchor D domain-containing protein [Deltaproteobacteria bacterium]|nr:choice-of-anchor D domain-containing protein [Deltaproteobacteria bacterium]
MLLLAASGCQEDVQTVFIARCENDLGCEEGEICIEGECVSRDNVSCSAIEGGKAILQPGPPVMDLGHVGSGSSMSSLILRNIGNCTLTVFEAYFESEEASPFQCPYCAADRFPVELFPFRDHQLDVFFTPDGVGTYEDTLILLSDDAEFSEIRVPVRATFNGIPEIAIVPGELDFDYAPVGRTLQRTLKVSNKGTGTAPLRINRVEIQSSTVTAFSFMPELNMPAELDPIGQGSTDELVFDVRYHPREIGSHAADLVFYTNMPTNGVVRVPLRGSSATPAKINVSPESLIFGPVPIGQTTALPLTIVNEGGSPLRVNYRWAGTGLSTDLSALPRVVPPVMPGQYTEMQVLVTATSPTPITGLLIIESNDPSRPSWTVPVSAEGQNVVGAQVIKLEMHFENGDDSAFDDDFRNVDMTLENPFGLVCNKQNDSPSNWGAFGNPGWLAFGPKEEPERIVLPDATQDGTYRVLLTYMEDCSSVPSGLVAALLGISVDVLIAYFTGGVGIGVSGDQVADAIEDVCFDHSSSAATVTVYLNGMIAAEVPVTLGRKGDYLYALDLVRTGGVFTVVP